METPRWALRFMYMQRWSWHHGICWWRRRSRVWAAGQRWCGHSATRSIFIFSAAWVAVTSVAASVALCRPLDTPDYLVPYYLRDITTRFRHYASYRKREGGAKYMTVEDFVRALLASSDNEPPDPAVVAGMTKLFTDLDADGNAYLSLSEFSFLMVLLTARPEDIKVLFSVLDEDRVGSLSLDEFAGVLRGLGCSRKQAHLLTRGQKNSIVRLLFGEDGCRRCTLKEVAETLDAVNVEVWTAEFRQFDTDHNDCITAEQFGKLIANHMIGSHPPFHIVGNIRKLRGSGETITLELWIGFHRIMQHADEIAEVVELFTSSGLPLRKKDFNRAVKAAGLPPFVDVELDLVMALFDRNNDGVVEFDEFISVMKQKLGYHYGHRGVPREKKNLPTRFVECVGEVFPH
ncbi:Ca2+ binding protein, contains EF-hand motif (ISS) [Trypanosoma rangeli]|uniref:Ca2+ binding protein, contains EF-hand motif (ISS) n=1 Tax=Trypanosoma rangeli TaxID=5698 RepID=A0A422NT64_TRYRA|nr:Ca2+ binding protein, contains EF-hand motif (ISS) [Trypanosoma rangeli]RNF08692.1 Ca2+ binding protein, contains EF-hand motif (ISS) [Trypanosoma rangeli]|eukprot:RNF08692.1 Ca2+ binding protein, contains EF-hand motif (ISS) [Trypanosoma rangeli]